MSRVTRSWIRIYVVLCILCISINSAIGATPKEIKGIFDRIEKKNPDVRISTLSKEYKDENLTIARSLHFPGLSFTAGANKAKEATVNTADYKDGSGNSVSPQASLLGFPSSFSRPVEGWSGQLSANYYLFTHFAVVKGVENAKTDIESATLAERQQRISKKAQFIQTLMEWQWLDSMVSPVTEALSAIERMREHAKNVSGILYTTGDEAELEEKHADMSANATKVREGKKIAEQVLLDLVPGLTAAEIAGLPKVMVEYEMPDNDEVLRKNFNERSVAKKIASNDLAMAENNLYVAKWKRPWIPTVALNGSYSKNGDYAGGTPSNNWSYGVVATFTLFDGFYTDARRAQAAISVELADAKRETEMSKRTIELSVNRMKARVAMSDFRLKNATARRKEISMNDVRSKRDSGVGTNVEMTFSTLAWVKAKADALDALKQYQSASLAVAQELDDFERVRIYEKN